MSRTVAALRWEGEDSKSTVPRNQRFIIGGKVALAALIFALDSQTPQGWTPAPLYVAVVGASMWLAGLQPIWIAATACALLTVLAFFVAPPGWINADLFNRSCSILAIWVVALFCVLYKRAERRSLELAAIVKSFGDAIISKNLDGVITTWNAGAERLFGYTAEEVLGRPVTLLFAPEHHDEESRILEAISRGEHITHFETERSRKDGSRVPVSLSASPILDSGGQVVGIATIARDISEEKRVAEALRASETRFRTFVDHAADAFFLTDDQGRVQEVNRRAGESLGYTRDELIGMTPYDFDPDLTPTMVEDRVARIMAGETTAHESRHRRKDGTVFPVEVRIQIFREGGRSFFVSLVRDITERKKAEQALRSIAQFPDENPYPIVRIAHAGTILYANQASAALCGQWQCEVGRPVSEPLVRLVRETLDSGQPKEIDLESGGRVFSFLFVPLADSGYVNLYGRDITDGKRAEEALRESQQMMAEAEALSHSCSWEWHLISGQWTFSDEWHAIHGVPKGKLTVEELLPIAHPDDRKRVNRAMEDARNGIAPYDLEHRILRQDTGEVRVVRARGRSVRDEAGQVVKVCGFAQDITERKRVEEALRESEERFRGTFENAAVGIAHEDLSGRFLRFNKRFCAILGYSPEELVGKTLLEVTYPEDLAEDLAKHSTLTRVPSLRMNRFSIV